MKNISYLSNFILLLFSFLTFLIHFFFMKLTFATLLICFIILITTFCFFLFNKKLKIIFFINEIIFGILILFINCILYFEPLKLLEKNHISKFIKRNNLNIVYDQSSRTEIYNEDLKRNIKPHRFPQLNNTNRKNEYFTFSNFSDSTIRHCNESGTWLKYQSDRYGFNNDDKRYQKKINTVFLGDSFFEAMCVKRIHNTSSLLSKKTKKNIINFSISGSGPLDYLGIFKEYGQNLNPDSVYIFFYEKNDLRDLDERITNLHLNEYLDKDFYNYGYTNKVFDIDNQLKKQFDIYLNQESVIEKKSFFNNVFNFLTLIKLRIFIQNFYIGFNWDNKNYELLKKNKEILRKIFAEFKHLSKKNNFKINFIYVPSANFIGKNKQSKIKDLLFSIVKKDLEPDNFIDLEVYLDNFKLDELYPFGLKNRHFNTNGHKLISEYLFYQTKF